MPTTYVISPDPAFFPFSVGEAVVSPVPASWRLFLPGLTQQSRVSPDSLFRGPMYGQSISTEIVSMHHAVPGVTTVDDEWPDDWRPQMRVNATAPVPPPEYRVMYHGCPGVSQGDDNWDIVPAVLLGLSEGDAFLLAEDGDILDLGPATSYQPQLRLNTLPHTADPVLVDGRWRVNEAFLAPAGA